MKPFKNTGFVLLERPYTGPVEPTRLFDSSRYKNHGTYTNITDVQLDSGLWVQSGVNTSDIAFNASITAVGSVSLWLNRDDNTLAQYLFDNRTNSGVGYGLFNAGSNTLTVTSGTVYVDKVATTTVGLLSWHLVCVSGITFTAGTTGLFRYRAKYDASGNRIVGDTGLLKVYNRTINLAEIRAIYNREKHYFGYGR